MGSSEAKARVGACYDERGQYDVAIEWHLRAAGDGIRNAKFNLGNTYMKLGDREAAGHWFAQAAEEGDDDAMQMVSGDCLAKGDIDQAVAWSTRAARLGNRLAQQSLPLLLQVQAGDTEVMYEIANGFYSKGKAQAASFWWGQATDFGHAESAFRLGELHQDAADFKTAMYWYQRSSLLGHPRGREMVVRMASGNRLL
ncbi:tetratricopeptide repeat protein [Agromyces laixinhei]|uniref:tetratricopeptide repeat protein n=1 Tax=Agromyces laixinhei TaxID=2585717 RepID=UPI0012EE5B22|nr:tetratricopeptide repeat protein [Agromyces laixinhei]